MPVAMHCCNAQALLEFIRGQYQVPADFLWLVRYLFTEVLDGRNAHLTDGIQRALGRPPRDLAEFARRSASAGVWNA